MKKNLRIVATYAAIGAVALLMGPAVIGCKETVHEESTAQGPAGAPGASGANGAPGASGAQSSEGAPAPQADVAQKSTESTSTTPTNNAGLGWSSTTTPDKSK